MTRAASIARECEQPPSSSQASARVRAVFALAAGWRREWTTACAELFAHVGERAISSFIAGDGACDAQNCELGWLICALRPDRANTIPRSSSIVPCECCAGAQREHSEYRGGALPPGGPKAYKE